MLGIAGIPREQGMPARLQRESVLNSHHQRISGFVPLQYIAQIDAAFPKETKTQLAARGHA
jgi:hypothetical protein